MDNRVVIEDKELTPYSPDSTLVGRMQGLLAQQKKKWDLAKKGYSSIAKVHTKEFEFDGFKIRVQFNPGRITSSSAKVDEKSIKERKCFLCMESLPEGQKGIPYYRDYLILVNPFPIFPEHFTFPKFDHIPQRIDGNYKGMLRITRDIGSRYAVFYNGPKCGASAPDHMHFQAGIRNFMPIEEEYNSLKKSSRILLYEENDLKLYGIKNHLRYFYSIESSSEEESRKIFYILLGVFESLGKKDPLEPMLNIITYYSGKQWKTLLFPRRKHRPSHYFEEGDKNILLSPASVDMGGTAIVPREKDFDKITKDDIGEIYREVSISGEYFEYYNKELISKLS